MKKVTFDAEQADSYLNDFFEPLLASSALLRLKRISFLGILSPRYKDIAKTPIYQRSSIKNKSINCDGSRFDHSIEVARLSVLLCENFKFSEEEQKYAVAWALLHDLGNWSLSHSAQQAFSELVGVKTKKIREWLITSNPNVPKKYTVTDELERCGIEPERLVRLFNKEPDADLQAVSNMLQDTIKPDTLEGVWRSANTFGVTNFDLFRLCEDWYLGLFNYYLLHANYIKDARQFWKTKGEVYRRFFSSKTTVHFESCWDRAVYNFFKNNNLSIEESLELDEDWLVSEIAEKIPKKLDSLSRWKPPIIPQSIDSFPETITFKKSDSVLEERSLTNEYK